MKGGMPPYDRQVPIPAGTSRPNTSMAMGLIIGNFPVKSRKNCFALLSHRFKGMERILQAAFPAQLRPPVCRSCDVFRIVFFEGRRVCRHCLSHVFLCPCGAPRREKDRAERAKSPLARMFSTGYSTQGVIALCRRHDTHLFRLPARIAADPRSVSGKNNAFHS